jgi:hypothetical protein
MECGSMTQDCGFMGKTKGSVGHCFLAARIESVRLPGMTEATGKSSFGGGGGKKMALMIHRKKHAMATPKAAKRLRTLGTRSSA